MSDTRVSTVSDEFLYIMCIMGRPMEAFGIALIVILILSVVIHELAHGYTAYWLGDPTAKLAGRLSFNPIVHLDPLMSVIVPGLLIFSGAPFIIGAAKPVPYNPYNLRDQKYGEMKIAAAGPAANILIAVVFAALVQSAGLLGLSDQFITLAVGVVAINLFLALFNLMPIPPLDGSKILPVLLPHSMRMGYAQLRFMLEQNALIAFGVLIFLFLFVLSQPLFMAIVTVLTWLVGSEAVQLFLIAFLG